MPVFWDTPSIKSFFHPSEFDSPDQPGSGNNMDPEFIKWLSVVRLYVKEPFFISRGGGFRTPEYNQSLIQRGYKAAPNSAHLKGMACDILVLNSMLRYRIIKFAQTYGITRIGVANDFIHLDLDIYKAQKVIWTY